MLEAEQLREFLTELNDKYPASLEEAEEILAKVDKSKTGAVNPAELMPAVNLWFVHCAEREEENEEEKKAAPKSSTCAVM